MSGPVEQALQRAGLRTQGIDAASYETTGYSCAELFLSRPAAEAAGPPVLAAVLL